MQILAALRDLLACPFSYVRYVYAFRHPGPGISRLVRNGDRPVWRSRFRCCGYGTRSGYRTFAKHHYESDGTISSLCSSCRTYEVQVKKDGFAEGVRTGIHLVVGQDAAADLSLRVGAVSEEVKVTGDAAMVSVTTQDVSGLVGERQVKDLPLNGRSYDLLLTLNPGIVNFTSEKTGGIGVSNSTTGNNFAVSGNRPQQNLFLLNGVEFTGAAEITCSRAAPASNCWASMRCANSTCYAIPTARNTANGPVVRSLSLPSRAQISCMGPPMSSCATTLLMRPTTSIRDRLRRFSATSLAGLSAGRSKRARLSSSATTKDCASICIRRRQPLFRTPHRAQRPILAFCPCLTCGRSRQREPRTSMGSPRSSAVPCKPFERI